MSREDTTHVTFESSSSTPSKTCPERRVSEQQQVTTLMSKVLSLILEDEDVDWESLQKQLLCQSPDFPGIDPEKALFYQVRQLRYVNTKSRDFVKKQLELLQAKLNEHKELKSFDSSSFLQSVSLLWGFKDVRSVSLKKLSQQQEVQFFQGG